MGSEHAFLDRFLAKILVNSCTDCWEWTARKDRYGYARIQVDGKNRTAHRVSYELHCGPIPDGMLVCHRCDNPGCVNPSHLFVGTNADNVSDMVAKDRHTKGASRKTAKLSEADAQAILRETGKVRDIAKKYGVGKSQIWNIRTGKKWAHLSRSENSSDLLKGPRAEPEA